MADISRLGRVYFIGAGPGDPELITVKGARLLSSSPVVIYAGSLVNPQLLENCRKDADIYDSASMNLDEIIEIISEAVAHGDDVARLHTGDPALFGAIHEQIMELKNRGIAYDVVPGVSSLFGAAAALERELTQPEVTQTVIISRIAGRTPVPKKESLASLAMHGATMALFLSVSEIDRVVSELDKAYPPSTPVAVVSRATWPDEQIVRGTLADIAAKVKAARIKKTALILVGEFLSDGEAKSKLYDKTFAHGYRRAGGDPGGGKSTGGERATGADASEADQSGSVAIVGITENGLRAASKVAEFVTGQGGSAVVYGPKERLARSGIEGKELAGRTSAALPLLLKEHKKLIAIMSLGIVVRSIGPFLANKKTDGAVVVADEALENFISVVGGHIGGANELARNLADGLGSRAVLTTSSDVQGLPAIDIVAGELGLVPENTGTLTKAAAALVNGEPFRCFSDLPGIASRFCEKLGSAHPVLPLSDFAAPDHASPEWSSAGLSFVVTERTDLTFPGDALVFRPQTLVAGVGCRRGTSCAEIDAALGKALGSASLHQLSVKALASADLKSDEAGLLEFADKLDRPLIIVSDEEILAVEDRIHTSEEVRARVGLPGVCEPAAIAASQGDLVVPKQVHGRVTIAIARVGINGGAR